jgi:hypothetical protein
MGLRLYYIIYLIDIQMIIKKLYFYYIIVKPKFHFLKRNLLDLKIKLINTK